jgi:hypothetical protein
MVASMAIWLIIGSIFLFLCPVQWEALGYIRIGQIMNSPIENSSPAIIRTSSPITLKYVLQNMKLGDGEKDIKKLQGNLLLRKIDERNFLIRVRAVDRALAQKIVQNIVDEITRQHEGLVKPTIQRHKEIIKQVENEQQETEKQIYKAESLQGNRAFREFGVAVLKNLNLDNKQKLQNLQSLLQPPSTEPTALVMPIYTGDTPIFPQKSTTLIISILLGLVSGFICVFGRREI